MFKVGSVTPTWDEDIINTAPIDDDDDGGDDTGGGDG